MSGPLHDAALQLQAAARRLTPTRWSIVGREPRPVTPQDLSEALSLIHAAIARIEASK